MVNNIAENARGRTTTREDYPRQRDYDSPFDGERQWNASSTGDAESVDGPTSDEQRENSADAADQESDGQHSSEGQPQETSSEAQETGSEDQSIASTVAADVEELTATAPASAPPQYPENFEIHKFLTWKF